MKALSLSIILLVFYKSIVFSENDFILIKFYYFNKGYDMVTHPSMLDKLKKQRQQLDARIQAVTAREKVAERKKELQRKILVGTYYLEEADKNKDFKSIQTIMDKFLIRNSDRKLFDLPEILEK